MNLTSLPGYYSFAQNICFIDTGFNYIGDINALPMNKTGNQSFDIEIPLVIPPEQKWAINTESSHFGTWGSINKRVMEMVITESIGNIKSGFRTYNSFGDDNYLQVLFNKIDSSWEISGSFSWELQNQRPIITNNATFKDITVMDNNRLVMGVTGSPPVYVFSDDNGNTWNYKYSSNNTVLQTIGIKPVKVNNEWLIPGTAINAIDTIQLMYYSTDNGDTWGVYEFVDNDRPSSLIWANNGICVSNGDYGLLWHSNPYGNLSGYLFTFLPGEYLQSYPFPHNINDLYHDPVTSKWWAVGFVGARYWCNDTDITDWTVSNFPDTQLNLYKADNLILFDNTNIFSSEDNGTTWKVNQPNVIRGASSGTIYTLSYDVDTSTYVMLGRRGNVIGLNTEFFTSTDLKTWQSVFNFGSVLEADSMDLSKINNSFMLTRVATTPSRLVVSKLDENFNLDTEYSIRMDVTNAAFSYNDSTKFVGGIRTLYEYNSVLEEWEVLVVSNTAVFRDLLETSAGTFAVYDTNFIFSQDKETWYTLKFPAQLSNISITGLTGNESYVVGYHGTGLVIKTVGQEIVQLFTAPSSAGTITSATIKDNICYVVKGVFIYTFDLITKTWSSSEISTRYLQTRSLKYYPEDNLFIRSGDGGTLETSLDNCLTWSSFNIATELTGSAINNAHFFNTSFDGTYYYAYSNNGLILRSSNALQWFIFNFGSLAINRVKKVGNYTFGFLESRAMLLRTTNNIDWEVIIQVPTMQLWIRAPRDIAFNGTTYLVTVCNGRNANSERLAYSTTDFNSWNKHGETPSAGNFPVSYGVCAWFKGYWYIGGGLAGGAGGTQGDGIIRSNDLINWELVSNYTSSTRHFVDFATDGTTLTTVGHTNSGLYTTDGSTWLPASFLGATNINRLKFLNGIFFATSTNIANGPLRSYYSLDGQEFIGVNIINAGYGNLVDFDYDPNNNLWMAISGTNNAARIFYTEDPTVLNNWTVNNDSLNGVGRFCYYGGDKFYFGKTTPTVFGDSVDGSVVNWTTAPDITGTLYGAEHFNSTWLLYGQFVLATSINAGATWTSYSYSGSINKVLYDSNTYYIADSTTFVKSTDLITYNPIIPQLNYNFTSLAHRESDNTLLASISGNNSEILYSSDKKTWQTIAVDSIATSIVLVYLTDTKAFAINNLGVLYTTDLITGTWVEALTLASLPVSRGIVHDGNVITIKTKLATYKSIDGGNTWEEVQKQSTTDTLTSIYSNDTNLVCVGINGTVQLSEDSGNTWETPDFPMNRPLNTVTYESGKWVIFSRDQSLIKYTTEDFLSFTEDLLGSSNRFMTSADYARTETGSIYIVDNYTLIQNENETVKLRTNITNAVSTVIPDLENVDRAGNIYLNSFITHFLNGEEIILPNPLEVTDFTRKSEIATDGTTYAFLCNSVIGYRIVWSTDLINWSINPNVITIEPPVTPFLTYANGKWVTNNNTNTTPTYINVFTDIQAGAPTLVEVASNFLNIRDCSCLNNTWVFITVGDTLVVSTDDLLTFTTHTGLLGFAGNSITNNENEFFIVSSSNTSLARATEDLIWTIAPFGSGNGIKIYAKDQNLLKISSNSVIYSNDGGETWQNFNPGVPSTNQSGYLFDNYAYYNATGLTYSRKLTGLTVPGNFNDIIGIGFNETTRDAEIFINGQSQIKNTVYLGANYPAVFAIAESEEAGASITGNFISNNLSYSYGEYEYNMCGSPLAET